MVVPDVRPRLIPKPLKPKFRYPKPRQRLTTVMAVDCADGVVLCADGQETNEYVGFGTKQLVSKIDQLRFGNESSRHCLLGCAGLTTYTNQLRERVEQAVLTRNGTYFEALEIATRNYSKFVNARKPDTGLLFDQSWASAIFAGYDPQDKKHYIYSIWPPHPPELLSKYPHRTGTGTGWVFASLLFVVAEQLMSKLEITWKNLSTLVAAQFCYMALGRIMNYDRESGLGTNIYRIGTDGIFEGMSDETISPGHSTETFRLPIILRTLMKEKQISKDKLFSLMEEYGLTSVIAEAFSEK